MWRWLVVVAGACQSSSGSPPPPAERPIAPRDAAAVVHDAPVDAAVVSVIGPLFGPSEPAARGVATGHASPTRADLGIIDQGTDLSLWHGSMPVGRIRGDFRSFAFSPDGSVIAARTQGGPIMIVSTDAGTVIELLASPSEDDTIHWIDDRYILGNGDKTLWLHDLEDPDHARKLGGGANSVTVETRPEAHRVIATIDDQMFELSPTKPARSLGAGGWPDISADGKQIAWRDHDKVIVWNLETGTKQRELAAAGFALSSADDRIALQEGDAIVVRSLATNAELARFDGHGDEFELSPDSTHVLAMWEIGRLAVYAAGAAKPTVQIDQDKYRGLFLGDGSEVLVWRFAPDLTVRRTRDGAKLRSYRVTSNIGDVHTSRGIGTASVAHARAGARARADAIVSATRDPAGSIAVVASPTGVGFVDLGRGAVVADAALASGAVRSLALSTDGHWLAVGDDAGIELVDLRTGATVHRLIGHTNFVTELAFDPASKRLATGSPDGTIRVWSIPDGAPIAHFGPYELPVMSPAWSPDGSRLAWSAQRRVCTWAGGAPACSDVEGGTFDMPKLHFTPDGKTLLLVTHGKLYARTTGAFVERHDIGEPSDVAFSPDGQTIYAAYGTDESEVFALGLGDNKERWKYTAFPAHKSVVSVEGHLALSRTGDRLVVAGDGVAGPIVIDTATGRPTARLAVLTASSDVAAR